MTSREYADIVQSQIVNDIRLQHDSLWTRRWIWDRGYRESRTPTCPAMLLELLSHQNFADMKHGLDPAFRFTVGRAIYKGMLKYLSNRYGVPYVVQPLPVEEISAAFSGEARAGKIKVSLRWKPRADTLEPTAAPSGYILQTRVDDGGFDNGKVIKIITPTITGEIKNYFRDKSRMIKLPRRLNEVGVRVRKYSAEYLAEKGEKATAKQIAEALSLPEEEVIQALEISGTLSLDTLANKDDEDSRSMHEVLADENSGFDSFETKEALLSAMKDFSAEEKMLIKYRFADELSQTETAEKLGVSQMFVSRTERKLLARMRERLKDSL